MATFKCVKETFFDSRLFTPGAIYVGSSAPKEYFEKTSAHSEAQPSKRIKADGVVIKPDAPETLKAKG